MTVTLCAWHVPTCSSPRVRGQGRRLLGTAAATRSSTQALNPFTDSCSTRVRIPHDSQLPTSRAAMWQLLQGLSIEQEATQLTTVLATLESIYGVEYQALAEQLLSSYQAALRPGAPEDALFGGSGDASGDWQVTPRSSDPYDHLSPAYTPQFSSWPAVGPAAGPAPPEVTPSAAGAAASAAAAAADAGPFLSSATSASAGDDAVLGSAEQRFMQLLLLLAQRAHYTPFTARDAQLGISLNTDYLWQLFIKASSRNLDRGLVAPWVREAGELPKEAQGLLMLRRGYGSEATQGRLLLQKLDYLQLLLIKRAVKGLSSLAATSSQQLLQQMCLLYQAFGGTLPHQQQQQQEEGAAGMTADVTRSPLSSSSSTDDVTSSMRVGAAAQGMRPPEEQQDDQSASQHTPANTAAAAGEAGEASGAEQAPEAGAAAEQEAEFGGQPAAAVDRVQANLQRTQAVAAAAASNAEKAVASAATHTARRLQQQLVESGQQLAEAMSDWGLIPRLGVIPLEQFEEVYPVREPGRLRPLYIQKASLPDILDPLVSRQQGKAGATSQQQTEEQAGQAADADAAETTAAAAAVAAGERARAGTLADRVQRVEATAASGDVPAAVRQSPQGAGNAAHAAAAGLPVAGATTTIGSSSSREEEEEAAGSTAVVGILDSQGGSISTGIINSGVDLVVGGSDAVSSGGLDAGTSTSTTSTSSFNSTTASSSSSFWGVFPQRVQIVEPTLREVLVVYRRQPRRPWLQWPPQWFKRGQQRPQRAPYNSKDRSSVLESSATPASGSSLPQQVPNVVNLDPQDATAAAAAAAQQKSAADPGAGPASSSSSSSSSSGSNGGSSSSRSSSGGSTAAGRLAPPPICVEVYRDIPLPSWQVVCPDKLLQFRPLDLLRVDLFALTGLSAGVAQQVRGSDNLLLALLPLVSVGVLTIRVVLGYIRMGDRYKSIVNELLRERTLASREGALEYLATAAALQQFKQTALAYTLMTQLSTAQAAQLQQGRLQQQTWGEDAGGVSSGGGLPLLHTQQQLQEVQVGASRPAAGGGEGGEGAVWWTPEQLAVTAEALLEEQLGLQVLFDAEEALLELRRLGLLRERCVAPGTSDAVSRQQQQQQQQPVGASSWLQAAGVTGRPASPAQMLSTVIDRLWSSNGRAKGTQSSSTVSSRPQVAVGKVSAQGGATGGPAGSGNSSRTTPGWGSRTASSSSSSRNGGSRITGENTDNSGSSSSGSSRDGSSRTGGSMSLIESTDSSSSSSSRDGSSTPPGGSVQVQYAVVGAGDARHVLQQHWADLLDSRVDSIVRGLVDVPPQQQQQPLGVRHGPMASNGSRRDK